jgi:hypothetical protein
VVNTVSKYICCRGRLLGIRQQGIGDGPGGSIDCGMSFKPMQAMNYRYSTASASC